MNVQQRPSTTPHRIFTRTQEGRRYDNGILLRKGAKVSREWQRPYFPRGTFHYPYYSPTNAAATVVISPYGFYFGVCAPFISRQHSRHAAPVVIYVDIPIYSGANCRGYPAINANDNLLDENYLREFDPGLAGAVDELHEAFERENIDALVTLTDPNADIAIFLQGKYAYSLPANDYLDLTRDAFRSTDTVSFDITRIHQRDEGVFVVSGEHVYTAHNGSIRRVYVSFVLENLSGYWTLTQAGAAPDRIQEW